MITIINDNDNQSHLLSHINIASNIQDLISSFTNKITKINIEN